VADGVDGQTASVWLVQSLRGERAEQPRRPPAALAIEVDGRPSLAVQSRVNPRPSATLRDAPETAPRPRRGELVIGPAEEPKEPGD
jgi:hypothetical protein